MFEYNGKKYDLRYSEKKLETIEDLLDRSVMGALINNAGALKLRDTRVIFCQGLVELGNDEPLKAETRDTIYEGVLANLGYGNVVNYIAQAIEKDCPFMFQTN